MKPDESYYDKDYYENGIASGKSQYESYRWLPEFTIPMAMTIIDLLGIKRDETILDFGCAKGYLVKAFRMLHRNAFGCDVSRYAIDNADADIKQFVSGAIPDYHFDYCIAKDVFEHMTRSDLTSLLENRLRASRIFAIIPLGNGGGYFAELNNLDKSHIICKPAHWWIDLFTSCGLGVDDFSFRVDGIKDKYYDTHPNAFGFFSLTKG